MARLLRYVVVENESHAWELTRYVHLNPCRAQAAPRPEAWAWSSYRHYLDPRGAPEWLDWPTVLAERSHREAAARIAYKRFVEAGLGEAGEATLNPLESAVEGWILGSEAFVKRVQTVCLAGGSQAGPQSADEVIAVVARVFGTSTAVIQRRGRHGNSARDAAMMLCRELLSVSASELAAVFGVSASGLSMTVTRAGERSRGDDTFAALLLRVREELGRIDGQNKLCRTGLRTTR